MEDGTRMKKKGGTCVAVQWKEKKRGQRGRGEEKDRKWEQKETEGQNERSEWRQREVNDYVARVRWPARSTLLPSLLVPREPTLFPLCLSLSLSHPFILLRYCDDQRHSFPSDILDASIVAPSQRSSKFSRAARTRKSYPYIFSVRPAKLIPPCAPHDTMCLEKMRKWYTRAAVRFVTPFPSLCCMCSRELMSDIVALLSNR